MDKVKHVTCYIMFNGFLPLFLLAASVVRFNGFSLVYLLLLMAQPLIPSPTPQSVSGKTGRYLLVSAGLCSAILLAQVTFQAFSLIIATPDDPYGTWLKNCSMIEKGLRQLGLQRLEPNDYANILRVILPDIGAFIITLLVLVLCKSLLPLPRIGGRTHLQRQQSVLRKQLENYGTFILNLLGNFLIGLFLAGSGIANPSILSAIYLFVFFGLATWWACYKPLGQRFAVLRVFMLIYAGGHLVLLYLYQLQFFQEILDSSSLIARIVGLTALVKTDCRKPWLLETNSDAQWWMYLSPVIILLLYFTLAIEIRRSSVKARPIPVSPPNHRSSSSSQHSNSSPRKSPRRRVVSGRSSERQVVAGTADESLVSEAQPRYNSTDNIDAMSVTPQSDIYNIDSGPLPHTDNTSQTEKIRSPLASLFVYIMKQSYVLTLIVMMVWSITYHSWLTFVFLLAACIVWMIPRKRNICLAVSPVIVCYAEGLLLIQYVYGFNLTDQELPTETMSGYSYSQIGLMKQPDACIHLGIQTAFTVCFMLTLRQYMRELHFKRQDFYMTGLVMQPVEPEGADTTRSNLLPRSVGDVIDGQDSETMKLLGSWLWRMMCKYWIIVCSILLLVISIQEPVIYRIIYLGFFLYFVITFQLFYKLWRLCIFVYWWIVIVYSMVVLLCIYTYQFENFPEYWKNGTGMSDEMLSDLGLETFSTAQLFAKLLTPTVFVIIICMQVHYFQRAFLQISDIKRFRDAVIGNNEPNTETHEVGETAVDGTAAVECPADDTHSIASVQTSPSRKQRVWQWMKKAARLTYDSLDHVSVFIWRIIEIHISKIAMLVIFLCCVFEICAINVILVLLVAVFMPVTVMKPLMSHFCQCYTGLVLLAKMVYQLKLVPHDFGLSNCTIVYNLNVSVLPYPFNETIDTAAYVGLQQTKDLPRYLQNYILIVVVLAFEAIIKVHQAQYYNKPGVEKQRVGIVFHDIKRENADDGLIACAKYFVNHIFYKFGLQICFIMTMVTMVVRLDAYSVIYGVFLAFMLCLSRSRCYRAWPFYVVVLIVLLVLQYLSCLGVPPALCWGYPWDTVKEIIGNLKIFLYLPNYQKPPDPCLLIADFFQLLFVCLQWNVFCIEHSDEADTYPGGSNKCILDDVVNNRNNPVNDFMYCKQSYLDYIKAAVFQYSFWVTLIFVFIAGTSKISLFCLGYLVGFFFFLWFGMTLMTKPLHKVVRLWGFMLGYTFFVILSKSGLQLVGCVYLENVANGYCWVIQLLGLACLRAGNYANYSEGQTLDSCSQSEDDAGLTYDAICFVFLLLQLRIYQSHYFRHVIFDLEVQQSMASRGAELINTRLIKQVAAQKHREQETLLQIKRKMEKIRLRQERLQHRAFTETQDHYIVIRGGDRYMFDEDNEETESSIDGVEHHDDSSDEDKAGPLQLINAAMTRGAKGMLQVVERQRTMSECEHSPAVSPSMKKASVFSRQSMVDAGTSRVSRAEDTMEEITLDGDDIMPDGDEITLDGDEITPDGDKITPDVDKPQDVCPETEESQKEGCRQKLRNGWRITWALIASVLDSMIGVLLNISSEYRSVSHILDQEKEAEKRRRREREEELILGEAVSVDSPDVLRGWPASQNTTNNQDSKTSSEHKRNEVAINIDCSEDVGDSSALQKRSPLDSANLEIQEQHERDFHRKMPRILQLISALLQAIMSRSELLCYFAMVLNTLVNASLLSLPYPISVFLWAMLSVPRPSKAYWITIMTYTEAVVVVKYLFQFGFFPWNDDKLEFSPFWPPRIIGIEKKDGYAIFDLVLLFCLFMHRSILNRHGLWKDATDIDADFALAEDKVASKVTTPASSPVKDDAADIEVKGLDNASYEASNPASPSTSKALVLVSNSLQVIDDIETERKCSSRCCRPITEFYSQMTNPRYNAVTDVYKSMFLCDFMNFLIIVFGYWAFGPVESTGATGTEGVTRVIENNRVPAPFLAMLVVQFVLIIVDRALYLRKNIFGKFTFQICLVIIVHVWMFFILPVVTNRSFTQNVPAQLWYFIKCIYFGLSAYQIRSGYPTRILGNFLTKRYNYANLFLFKGFLLIPFLLELRALMDWMWTDTTLALSSWLTMEDIYANIFEMKCWRWAENKYPTPRSMPRQKAIKYGVGGLLLVLLIFILWFPLLLFSLASAVFKPNPPVDCTIEMKFGGYQPIFKMSAQQQQLHVINEHDYEALKEQYSSIPGGMAFLSVYQPDDIYIAEIHGISTSTWDISPPSEASLHNDLLNEHLDIKLYTTIAFRREPKSGMTSDTVSNQFLRELLSSDKTSMNIRIGLANMLNNTYHDVTDGVIVPSVFPQFLQVPVNGKPTVALALLKDNTQWSNISYQKGSNDNDMWWELKDILPHDLYSGTGEPRAQDNLIILSFNERVAPGALTFLTSYGILGLYLSFILVIGRFIRVQTSGLTRDVMFNFLPYVDSMWSLVKDIYLVREAGEYRLEEELFAKLMFLYRSPETLINYTRYPPEKLKQD